MGVRRGDKLIIVLNSNEQFLDAFWAAVCGGIIPVPLSVGLNDEHRHKVLRVARTLSAPPLYTDLKISSASGGVISGEGRIRLIYIRLARTFLVEPSRTFFVRGNRIGRPLAIWR